MTDIMLLAKALKLGSLREWLRLCGGLPEGMVTGGGMAEDSRWRKRCKEMIRMGRNWLLQPPEEMADGMRESDALNRMRVDCRPGSSRRKMSRAGQAPWELFTRYLHNKVGEDEMGVLFLAKSRKTPRNSYP